MIKYKVLNEDGSDPDSIADFLVLRLDNDLNAIRSAAIYAKLIVEKDIEGAQELIRRISLHHDNILKQNQIVYIREGTAKCHSCIYKRLVPGDTHIACDNPDPKVRGSEHGIKNGWFFYPVLFDPTWMIIQCNNFKEK